MTDTARSVHATRLALVVALGGFLMGFDSAVISGVVDPLRGDFGLDADQVGWAVSCLTLGATLAMALAGPLADRLGRRPVLLVTAALFTVSAVSCAVAESFAVLVLARIIGGFGVGGALLIAPIYIAEIAPPHRRGQLVSFNQLNIVLGFSAAFFSNYFLERAGLSWRWMLGVEAIPAAVYGLLLLTVPRSPRWLAMRGRSDEARRVLARIHGEEQAAAAMAQVEDGLRADAAGGRARAAELFRPRMRRVMLIGLGLGFFQQITGINAIFYYSTTIFGMAGAARDTALGHAILVGLVNVAFTVLAMYLIDRLGRRPLLLIGCSIMALALFSNGAAFHSAHYVLQPGTIDGAVALPDDVQDALRPLVGVDHDSELTFLAEVRARCDGLPDGSMRALEGAEQDLAKHALRIDGLLVLISIMAYIAAFAISLGPVMWAMFSEIFPQRLRGAAISVAGFFNSAVSFGVQQLFPRGLETLGPGNVFFVFGGFALLAVLFTWRIVPETKGRSLEDIERQLTR
ncbi:MAG: sugar porter family MFS transporter [Planctomycetota bacterium]